MLILTRSDITSVLEIEDVIEVVEGGHADLSTGAGVDLGSLSGQLPGSSALMIPICLSRLSTFAM